MAYEINRPLDSSALSADAQRALQGPTKAMAARGLAPLPNPIDLLSVLFQLSTDEDPKLRAAATETARGLPENLTLAALERQELDPKVLHFFAAISGRDSPMAQRIILNQSTADQTIVELTRRASEREVNLISANEERLLRCPEIIGALYSNANALQSVVDRSVELAIRNKVRVPGIAAWEDLVHELLSTGQADKVEKPPLNLDELSTLDRLVRRYTNLKDDELVPDPSAVHDLPVTTQMRIAMIGPGILRNALMRSRKSAIAMTAIKSPKVTEADAAKYAGNLSLSEDVIRYIANRREWTKNYSVKTALVNNPKCPLPAAMKMMPFLRERELSNLSRSKGIPSALRAQARKLTMQRKGGKGG